MSQLLPQILLPLALGSAGLLVLLSGLLLVERLVRNRRERIAGVRRRGYVDGLAGGHRRQLSRIASAAARRFDARCDLVDALAQTGWSSGAVFGQHVALRRAASADIASDDAARRAVGASLLGVIGGTVSVGLLEGLLRTDPDLELRLIAARGLRVIGSDEAAATLIRGLRDDVLPAPRILEQLGRPYAAGALVDALDRSAYRHVRAELAEALGLARHLPAAESLAALVTSGDQRERTKAGRALGRLGDPLVVPLLARAMDDVSWVVRAQVATALGACADGSAVGPLARALGDASWWVRANSAASLRQCGPAGLAALQHAAATHPDAFARDRALEALAMSAASEQRAAA